MKISSSEKGLIQARYFFRSKTGETGASQRFGRFTSSGRIEIKCSEKIKELYITDFAGKVLEKIETTGKTQNWQADLSNYPSGTYLIRYFTEQKGWGAEKIVLVR